MITQDKLYEMFGKPYNYNTEGPLGRLYISREAQKFFAVQEQESRGEIQTEFSRLIAKGHAKFQREGVSIDTPLITTEVITLKAVSKYDDSKIDAKNLLAAIKAEFKCSDDRAKAVIAASRVRPEKISLVINRLD